MAQFRTDPSTGRLIPAGDLAPPQHRAEPARASRMQNWRNQRRPQAGSTQGYSRFVRVMKVTLPLVAFSLVVLVVVYSTIGRENQNVSITYTEMSGDSSGQQIKSLRLTGADGRGQPFTVTAKSATQAPGRSQRLDIDGVVGDVTMQDKSWLALEAKRGLYDGEAKLLDLYDAINIYSDKGYECHTTSARYDFAAGLLQGANPINCQGPLGIITAKEFEGLRDPGRMTFTGGVTTVIYPTQRNGAAPAPAVEAVTDASGAPVPSLVTVTDDTTTPASAAPATAAPSAATAGTPKTTILPRPKPTPPTQATP